MRIVVRDRAMQISDIVNIESLALALAGLGLGLETQKSLALRLLALALMSLAVLTSLVDRH